MNQATTWPDRSRRPWLENRPTRVLRRLEAPLASLLALASCIAPASAEGVDSVRAELGQSSAWTGEGVPLVITLYSRGPFASAPAFDLPQLPRSAIVRAGSPLVGSEDVDGETWFTQRHEFTVYTQSTGEIVLPAIRVRFEAKDALDGQERAVDGRTPELHFTSRRPPGTETLDAVVATTGMEIRQDWTPAEPGRIEPGAVIERKVVQMAARTTAMMLPELAPRAPAGVRVYVAPPVVRDRVERGEFIAERTDSIKYQFERSGRYALPPIGFSWWDPAAQSLRHQVLEGREVRVGGALSSLLPPTGHNWPLASLLGALALLTLPVGWACVRSYRRWRTRGRNPEWLAARLVRAACRANDARGAYASLLRWYRSAMRDGSTAWLAAASEPEAAALRNEAIALAARNFGAVQPESAWEGSRLWSVFGRLRRRLRRTAGTGASRARLPPLNP